jgi:hypothetical protein
LVNNGMSFMLMNTQTSQRRESWTKSSASMLKDHSTLSPTWIHTSILILSTIEIWLLKQETEETLKSGGSIKSHWLSRPSWTTNPSISSAQEDLTTCKSGAPTQIGGRSSSLKMIISSTGRMVNPYILRKKRKVLQ